MSVRKWFLLVMGSLLATTFVAGCFQPARATGTPLYTWPVSAGTDLIWWDNATGTSWYEKKHVVEINQTNPGILYDMLYEKTFRWNESTEIWDALFDGAVGPTSAVNHSWQLLTGLLGSPWGYYAAWLDAYGIPIGGSGPYPEYHPNFMPLMGTSINMTWFNESFFIYYQNLYSIFTVPPELIGTFQDYTWILTNTSGSPLVVYNVTWTSGGILEYIEQRDSTYGNLIEKEILVKPPTITLVGVLNLATLTAGTAITSVISDTTGIGVQLVKYLWSTSSATPDWATEGTVWTSPYQLNVPEGASGRRYLHIYAAGKLGNAGSKTFTFEITPGIAGFPVILLFGMIGMTGVLLTMKKGRYVAN